METRPHRGWSSGAAARGRASRRGGGRRLSRL